MTTSPSREIRNGADASWHGRVALAEADARPGRYYVTARDERGRTAFLLGPFVQPTWGKEGHARALGAVRRARRYLNDHNFRDAPWLRYGTAWMPLTGEVPVGKLNDLIGGAR